MSLLIVPDLVRLLNFSHPFQHNFRFADNSSLVISGQVSNTLSHRRRAYGLRYRFGACPNYRRNVVTKALALFLQVRALESIP
jgi:hypothetical protein